MAAGLFAALVVTLLWVGLQISWMHFRPARSRIGAMTLAFLLSLPWVWPAGLLGQRLLPAAWLAGEAPWLGWALAYLFHVLLYFFYVECFYHIERAVTLRLLVEIRQWPEPAGPPLAELQSRYHVDEMVGRRLAVLAEHGYLHRPTAGFGWRLTAKGQCYARLMNATCWIFQSLPQDQRL